MKWYNSLRFKLIITVSIIILIILTLFSYFMLSSNRKQLIKEMLRSAGDISEVIKKGTYLDMLEDNRDNVYNNLTSIAENPDILKLRIYNKDGQITFSTDPNEKGTFVDKGAEACYTCHSKEEPLTKLSMTERSRIFKNKHGKRVLGVINPIYNDRKCYTASCHIHPENKKTLGIIDVDMALDHIDQSITRNTYIIIFFTCVVIVILSLSLIIFTQKFLSKPIQEIVDGMKKISEGELTPIPIKRHDELSYVKHSFNNMTADLHKAKLQLQEMIDNLEDKVRQRTRELTEMQHHMVESEKLASLGRLAAGIAHELNNPLGSILIYSNLVLDDLKDEGETKENMKKIIQEIIRTKDIIKGLLEFARIRDMEIKITDLHDIINKTLMMLMVNKIIFQKIEIKKIFHLSPLFCYGDASQIQQVFTNLIINAAEAIEEKGEITIQTGLSKDGKFTEISITDMGVGIPPENMKKLFEPFFTTKSKQQGTGLGLAVSYNIITRHKGRIEVKSEVGKGSTFTIKLPVSKAAF